LTIVGKREVELGFGNIDTDKLGKRKLFFHHLDPILANTSSHAVGSSDGSGSKMNGLRSR
jgi:hypothetical protein